MIDLILILFFTICTVTVLLLHAADQRFYNQFTKAVQEATDDQYSMFQEIMAMLMKVEGKPLQLKVSEVVKGEESGK